MLTQLGLQQLDCSNGNLYKGSSQKSMYKQLPVDFVARTLQRALLERLTGLISTPVGDAVPAGVVALEAMRLIIEVVGEVSSDEVHRMRQPCITKLTAHPQPLQSQVCPLAPHLCLEAIIETHKLCEKSLCASLSLPLHSSSAWNPCHCQNMSLVAVLPLRKTIWPKQGPHHTYQLMHVSHVKAGVLLLILMSLPFWHESCCLFRH